jgi:hypothetical protein
VTSREGAQEVEVSASVVSVEGVQEVEVHCAPSKLAVELVVFWEDDEFHDLSKEVEVSAMGFEDDNDFVARVDDVDASPTSKVDFEVVIDEE